VDDAVTLSYFKAFGHDLPAPHSLKLGPIIDRMTEGLQLIQAGARIPLVDEWRVVPSWVILVAAIITKPLAYIDSTGFF
jgi:hypothetical protein